jgi:uncharacterized membrane protein YkoI
MRVLEGFMKMMGLVLIPLLGFALSGFASDKAQEASTADVHALAEVSFSEAVEIAKRQSAGIITEISLENKISRLVYEIEMRADKAKRRKVDIDAITGEVIKTKEKAAKKGEEKDD